MARALRVRLIAIKKELQSKKSRIHGQKAEIEEELSVASPDKEAGLYEAKHKTIDNYLCCQREINRAEAYGRLYATDAIFRCIPCYVFHEVLKNMKATKSFVAGVKRYKCSRCGEELNSDDQP